MIDLTVNRLSLRLVSAIAIFAVISCSKNSTDPTPEPSPLNSDPHRCIVVDLGEAADFIQSKDIADDRLVVMHGLANPQALVWRNAETNQVFYIARIMGAQRRLYFMRQVAEDEKPGIASRFEGHLLKWQHLDRKRAFLIANALEEQYNLQIKPNETYIIIAGEKPKGCP